MLSRKASASVMSPFPGSKNWPLLADATTSIGERSLSCLVVLLIRRALMGAFIARALLWDRMGSFPVATKLLLRWWPCAADDGVAA